MLTATEARPAVSETPKPRSLALIDTAIFQVAAHPQSPAFSAPSHGEHHRERSSRYRHDAPTSRTGALSLPRTLARPPFTGIARDALLAAAPELSGVPAEFIRHGLRAKAPQMLPGIAALVPSRPPTSPPSSRIQVSHIPAALSVPLRPARAGSATTTHAIFPVHAVALAAHCAKFPRLPPSVPGLLTHGEHDAPRPPADAPLAARLRHPPRVHVHPPPRPRPPPRLALALALPPASPSPSPSPPPSSQELTNATLLTTLASLPALHALASHLCASSCSNLSALVGHAGHVKELWQDTVALGVYDAELWDALDLAWEVVLGALNLATQ
ncbi:hypothetical protein DFH09DRAFT_1314907 [Mycena vulgaris]|nr:hypothetical protein DFH09DRAFT_1314907 [Mycena vulgaris]